MFIKLPFFGRRGKRQAKPTGPTESELMREARVEADTQGKIRGVGDHPNAAELMWHNRAVLGGLELRHFIGVQRNALEAAAAELKDARERNDQRKVEGAKAEINRILGTVANEMKRDGLEISFTRARDLTF